MVELTPLKIGKELPLGKLYALFVIHFVILVVSYFHFEGRALVHCVSVPGHCLLDMPL